MTLKLCTYYFDQLNGRQKDLYKKIVKGIKKYDKEICYSGFLSDIEIEQVILAIRYECPELFYVNLYQYSIVRSWGIKLRLSYFFSEPEAIDYQKRIEHIWTEIKLDVAMSDLQKVRVIHNYLCRYSTYNMDSNRQFDFSIVGPLVEKKAVCEGIAKAFYFLGKKAGLNVMVATGDSKSLVRQWREMNSEGHAWNIVSFEGIPVHIDVTWDMCLSQQARATRYDYFALSDLLMSKDHLFSNLPACLNDQYSYFQMKNVHFSSLSDLKKWISKNPKNLYFRTTDTLAEQLICNDTYQSLLMNTMKIGEARMFIHRLNETQNCFYTTWRN